MRLGRGQYVLVVAGLVACGEGSKGEPSSTGEAALAGTLCEGLVRPVPTLEPDLCTAPQEVERHCQVHVATAPENPAHAQRPDGADHAFDALGKLTLEGGQTYTRDYPAQHVSVTDQLHDESAGCVALRSLV